MEQKIKVLIFFTQRFLNFLRGPQHQFSAQSCCYGNRSLTKKISLYFQSVSNQARSQDGDLALEGYAQLLGLCGRRVDAIPYVLRLIRGG